MFAITYETGSYADFKALCRFHYCGGKPATVARVVRAVCTEGAEGGQAVRRTLAGVAVLSYPVPCCAERNRVFGIGRGGKGENLRFVNRHLRVISRVVVHPRFRALGIGTGLVRALIEGVECEYVEARAHLGRAVPLFERAGMKRVEPVGPGRPAYFWCRGGK